MPNIAINFGRILILIGVIGYAFGVMNERTSATALIPAFFGIVIMLLGYFARMKESLRKHLMHAALLVAVLGFLAVAGRLISKIGEFALTPAYISQLVTGLVLLAFVLIGVKSFIDARKSSE